VGRSRHNGSTGLGLAIVDAVVAAHGGAVSVASRPGRTQFAVWLPEEGSAPRPAASRNADRTRDTARADTERTPRSLR
jgi:K+-sensing histidine kinase KdpD